MAYSTAKQFKITETLCESRNATLHVMLLWKNRVDRYIGILTIP
jgi:hypothetical protein